tara:strand:- start:389 stop:916 length:528 start_codon:yes stop_codon:yes gene_type:complete
MNDKSYSIIFKKEIDAERKLEEVKANLAKLFKAGSSTIDKMFLRESIVIKKGLSEEQAQKYRDAVKKAGAIVYILETRNSKQETENETIGPKPIEATTSTSWGSLVDLEEFVPAEFDTTDYVLAAVGAQIVPETEVERPNYDFKNFGLAPVGETLVEETEFVPAEFDTQHLKIKD